MSKGILVVDDDPDIVALVELVLTTAGFEVSGVTSGEEVIGAAEKGRPALIILDIMMPGVDGWEVYRRIRDHEVIADTPVLILTAKNSNMDKMIGLHVVGVNEYITKPFGRQQLVDAVQRLTA